MGQTAIVTGGTRGIGRQIALTLGQRGYDLVLAYRRGDDAARDTSIECQRLGVSVEAVRADVASSADVERLFGTAEERFGSIDVLVNNAGLNVDKPICDLTEADWDAVLDTNLKGVFLCCQRAARVMRRQHSGAIVNVGASTGIQGRVNGANYCASKAGVLVLTKCLALELAPAIRVNCVIPGSIADGGRARTPEEESRKAGAIPLGRLGSAAEVAAAVAFLVSDHAAYITGQKFFVDGGQFMF